MLVYSFGDVQLYSGVQSTRFLCQMRTEDYQQARERDRLVGEVWRSHPGFVHLDNSTDFGGKPGYSKL